MNEERDREELPGTPPLVRGEKPGEFERMRGETQLPGARVLAVPPPGPPAPAGISPPDPRNVVSVFDTRPISAYDFARSGVATMGNGEVLTFTDVSFDVPDGYTAVLRRVRLEFSPPGAMIVGNPAAGASPAREFQASLLRNGGVIPNNLIRFFGDLDEYEWPTHQVFGQTETYGIRLNAPNGWAIPANVNNALFVGVTFMGTLIPTKSRPPELEIASDPVVTRDYETMIREMPRTGAAGDDR